jgi:hypothetical protein
MASPDLVSLSFTRNHGDRSNADQFAVEFGGHPDQGVAIEEEPFDPSSLVDGGRDGSRFRP